MCFVVFWDELFKVLRQEHSWTNETVVVQFTKNVFTGDKLTVSIVELMKQDVLL